MRNKLIIGILLFSQPMFAGTNGTENLNNSFSSLTFVSVAALVILAIYTSLKAYEAVLEGLEKEIDEQSN